MAASTKAARKANRRSEILQAAEMLMQTSGLSGVTTRRISQKVGCSEGALYFHFKGRLDLLLAMLEESLPDMLGPLHTLRESRRPEFTAGQPENSASRHFQVSPARGAGNRRSVCRTETSAGVSRLTGTSRQRAASLDGGTRRLHCRRTRTWTH